MGQQGVRAGLRGRAGCPGWQQHSHEEAVGSGEHPLSVDDGAAADVDGPVLHADLPGPFVHRGLLPTDDPAGNPLAAGWRGQQGWEKDSGGRGARRGTHTAPPPPTGTTLIAGNALLVVFYHPENLLEDVPFSQPWAEKGGRCSQGCEKGTHPQLCPSQLLTCASQGDVLSRETVGAVGERSQSQPQPRSCGTRAGGQR